MAQLIDALVGHQTQQDLWLRAFSQQHLPHAFLFVGPAGVGKKTAALAFAQKLICPQGGCGECPSCLRVSQKASENLLLVEAEERQIKIEQAKEIIKFLSLRSHSKAQVVIVDGAEKLNPQAANALLKVIEEPPEGSYFFLIAPSEGSILPTLRSRCQVMRFSRLNDSELSKLVHTEASDWRISASQGSLEIFEQLSSPELKDLREKAFVNLNQLFKSQELEDDFVDLFKKREECGILLRFWQQLLRDIRVYQSQGGSQAQKLVHRDYAELIVAASELKPEIIDQTYRLTLELERDWMANVDRQMLLMAFVVELKTLMRAHYA